jgi:glycosyltransferase involved in cell wall biosynthesis
VIDLKRPIELLRAFKAAQTVGKSAHLLVVGEGPLRGACEELARAEKLPVTFTGFMNQGKLPEAYAASDVLVLCSMETWGLVVNEAMAAGLPAILSDQVGCAPDLVPSGETGMVYPHGDDEALARCMKTYLEKPVLARLHGDKARELVTTRYNVCGAADRTIEALLRII